MMKPTRFGVFALSAIAASVAQAGGNYIELGAGYLSDESGHVRRFSGMEDDGAVALAGFGYENETENGTEITAEAKNLGVDARSGSLEIKNQGNYRLRFEASSLPHMQAKNAVSNYSGNGSDHLVPLDDRHETFDLYTRRQNINVQADVHLSSNWKLSSNFARENKTGSTLMGGSRQGMNNFGSPVDHITDTMRAGLHFVGTDAPYAFNVNYALSSFENDNEVVHVGADKDKTIYLAPDNYAHMLTANGVYRLSQTGRISMNGRRSHMRQNQDFSTFGYEDAGRSKVDAKVDQTYLNLAYTDRFSRKSNIRARYTYQDRNNRTPVAAFGSKDQENRPYSSESHKFDLEGGYRLTSSTRLIGSYAYETVNRKDDYLEVDDLGTHSVMGKMAYRQGMFNGGLSAEYKRRRGDDYNTDITGDKEVSRYFLADLNETRVRMNGSYQFSQNFTGSAEVNAFEQKYVGGDYGLKNNQGTQVLTDLTYNISQSVNVFAHASASQGKGKQTFTYTNRGDDTVHHGSVDAKDTYTTLGFGSQWNAGRLPLTVTVDYSYSNAKTRYDRFDSDKDVDQLDDPTTKIHHFSVDATYRYTERLELKGMYSYERSKLADFAFTDMEQVDSNYVYLGDPNVRSHFVGLAVRYHL